MAARILFAFVPAVFLSSIACAVALLMGCTARQSLLMAAPVFLFLGGIGWSATRAHPERGEGLAARAAQKEQPHDPR